MQNQWLELCRTTGIDPQEVRLIYARYDAYREFTGKTAGTPIPLSQWFRFYYREKNSEGLQAGAPVEGCSADGDAVNHACLLRPGVFLEILQAYDATRPPRIRKTVPDVEGRVSAGSRAAGQLPDPR